MPIAASAAAYNPALSVSPGMAIVPNQNDPPMAPAMSTTDAAVEIMPSAMPAMMTVAGPVSACFASFLTGG